jgi:hypothetical protein
LLLVSIFGFSGLGEMALKIGPFVGQLQDLGLQLILARVKLTWG